MKWLKSIGLLFAFACIGVAGWQFHQLYADKNSVDDARRPPRVVKTTPDNPPALPATPLPPATRPAKFLLNEVPPLPLQRMTEDDWLRAYPLAGKAPFDQSGFNAIALPWRYGTTVPTEANEPTIANAFAFLLSSDLDWSPASFNTRPSYFVFKRMRDRIASIDDAYDPKKIAIRVRSWNGTHAIGGVLVRGKDGYVATLQIFDRDGRQVHEKAFEQPQKFFSLLGDVSASALTYFKTPPNEALVQHLHRERCEWPQSLTTLGQAAFAEEGSKAELALYDDVLEKDPRFAEVRQWRATQLFLNDQDADAYAAELARSLDDAVHISALAELHPELKQDLEMTRRRPRWIAAVEALAGDTHPDVAVVRLIEAINSRQNMADFSLKPFLQVAAKYPNHRRLLNVLTEYQWNEERQMGFHDLGAEVGASLGLTNIFSRSLPLSGYASEWTRVAQAVAQTGRYDHVLAATERLKNEPDAIAYDWQRRYQEANAKMQLGRLGEAAVEFAALSKAWISSIWREKAASRAAVCAVLANRPDLIEAMAIDPSANTGQAGQTLAGCRKYLAGDPVSMLDFSRGHPRGACDLLVAESELAQGGNFDRRDRSRVWDDWSQSQEVQAEDRLRWILLERYFRTQPTLPYISGFYEAAEWERAYDPYVKSVVAAWRKAGGDPKLPSAEQVSQSIGIRQWGSAGRAPEWLAVARIRRDLQEGNTVDAKRVLAALAERLQSGSPRLSWLRHEIEKASIATQQIVP